MKRLILFLLVFACSLFFVYGRELIVIKSWEYSFTPDQPYTMANDFHFDLNLHSYGNKIPLLFYYLSWDPQHQVTWYMNKSNFDQTGTYDWDGLLDFKTTGGHCDEGAIIHCIVAFKLEGSRYVRINQAWWTYNGQCVDIVDTVGIDVRGAGIGLPEVTFVTLFNDTANPITVDHLEFAVNPTQIPYEDMDSDGLGVPGNRGNYPGLNWIPYNGPIELQPNTNIDINITALGVVIYQDQFLQFRANIKDNPNWWQTQQ